MFAALDRVEEILSKGRYLTGSQLTEADVRLYTTLARFDMVYVSHFKVCCVVLGSLRCFKIWERAIILLVTDQIEAVYWTSMC